MFEPTDPSGPTPELPEPTSGPPPEPAVPPPATTPSPWLPVPPVAGAGGSAPAGWAPGRSGRDRLPSVRVVFAFLLAIAITFGVGWWVGDAGASGGGTGGGTGATGPLPAPSGSFPPEFTTFEQAWQIIHDKFVDPTALDPTALTYGAIDGLVNAVGDTDHTRFLTPKEVADEHTSLSGSVVGIGALMNTVNGASVIQSVIPGGPADRAGLRSGDHILAVDGVSTEGQSVDTVVSKIRGVAGTTVTLSVLHKDAVDPIEVRIVREKVTVPAISWAMIPGSTFADIRLEEFSTDAGDQLVAALKAARAAGASGIVLDLRSNPGGYVSEAVAVASQFIAAGTVYQERDRSGKQNRIPVKPGGSATTIPLTVLIDEGTASSAEIVSGAIQDAKRAKLIGAKTFGTGTVLNEFPLADGSALLVGTVEWLTRDGREIWKHGIEPDIALQSTPAGTIVTPGELDALGTAGLATSGDAQLLKAVDVLRSPTS